MRKIFLIVSLFLLNTLLVKSQDPFFSLFEKNPLILNPANTGYFNGVNRLGVSHRSQWKSVTTPFTTTSAFYDLQLLKDFKEDRMGLGLVFLSDRAGDVQMGITQVALSFSYAKILTKENAFMFGFQGGYMQRNFDFQKAKWDNQYVNYTYNAQLPSNEKNTNATFSCFDFAAGMNWGFRPNDNLKSTTGLALLHISSPKFEFIGTSKDGLSRKIVAHNKTEIYINKSPLSYETALLYSRQGASQQIIGGAMLRLSEGGNSFYSNTPTPTIFSLGGYYRTDNAIILAARLNYSYFELNFAYDLNTSDLGKISKSQGGFELSLVFIPKTSKKKGNKKGAPSFFD